MFPSTNGSVNPKDGNDEITGRMAGFNWSAEAAVTDKKNPGYQSDPVQLIKNIQTLGYDVYSPKYLDYEFYLDRDTLRAMRKEINDGNYTDYAETGFQKSTTAKIGYYYSQRIRDLGTKNKTPDKSIIDLVCNNLQLDNSGHYLNYCTPTNGEGD